VFDELIPSAWHHVERYAKNPLESDHGRLKHRLRTVRGLRSDRTARVITTGHAFVQNLPTVTTNSDSMRRQGYGSPRRLVILSEQSDRRWMTARGRGHRSAGSVALADGKIQHDSSVRLSTRGRATSMASAFAGFRFPAEVIVVAVRWYLRYNLSYRDVEELLLERGVEVDHVTVFRWVQRFTPLLVDAARFTRHAPGDRWFVDETYIKVGGVWRYVYRAVDQHGQVIDVLVSGRRDAEAARRFFHRALTVLKVTPAEVVTDAAPVYPAVLDELIPSAWHHVERYANNPIEADHGRLKHRLRAMRGLRTDRTAQVITAGHGFIQNLHRGYYELGVDTPLGLRVAAAFSELARAI
jgi:transposase-like protein